MLIVLVGWGTFRLAMAGAYVCTFIGPVVYSDSTKDICDAQAQSPSLAQIFYGSSMDDVLDLITSSQMAQSRDHIRIALTLAASALVLFTGFVVIYVICVSYMIASCESERERKWREGAKEREAMTEDERWDLEMEYENPPTYAHAI